MSHVAILGMATADQVLRADAPVIDERTALVRRLGAGGARCGGAPFYAGAALALAGHACAPVFDLGDDAEGDAIRAACGTASLGDDGIAVQPGRRTPFCLLVYTPDGRDLCLFDPGSVDARPLGAAQAATIAQADLIVIAAAPPARIGAVLDTIGDRQRLAWIFKDDPACFPDDLCARLMRRADLIFHNQRESLRIDRWAGLAPPSAAFFRTLGRDGVMVARDGETRAIPAEPLDLADPTGAGDTFAGHTLAAILSGASPAEAARQALARTHLFLAARADEAS